jgi:predicted aspartyl protease
MRFPYSSYEVDQSPTVPNGVIYRPEIIVRVIGPRGIIAIQALVDTGSDETVLPVSLAIAIGINLDYQQAGVASGVSGHPVELAPGRVAFELIQDEEIYRWQATVAFLELASASDEVALLGHSGFLEYFTANFDSENRELILTANRRMLNLQGRD